MGEITKLTKATSKSDSLRTTVPKGIVKQLNLKEGDEIDWRLTIEKNEIVVMIKPKK